MSTTDNKGQSVTIPTLNDEPNIEALIATVNALVSPGILKFQNATVRAANIPSPVHGQLVDLVDEDRIDRWDGSRWFPITPGPWHAFPYASGYGAEAGSPGYRYVNGMVQFRGQIRRTSGGQFYWDSDGTAWTPGTMPSGWRPQAWASWPLSTELGAGIYSVRGECASTGEFQIRTPPGSSSTSNGLHWIDLHGASYPLDTPPATL